MGDDLPGAAVSKLGPNASGRFWLAIVLTGLATGLSAAALTLILRAVQHWVWPGPIFWTQPFRERRGGISWCCSERASQPAPARSSWYG